VGYNISIASTLLPRRYASPTLVARGGMAEVYRATDSVLGRPVAVKLLSERHSRDPEVRARFEREAVTAARLFGQRHVISVFDVGAHGGRPLIVMEYLDGGTVHDRLVRGRISREQALDWLEQIAQALDKAHARGIVHRDVKPANLLLDRDGSIHVADFGIASAAGLDTLTLPGTVLGTAGYLAPEQARGEPATPASDRYALGVVAFEFLTGRRPFAADTPMTEAFAHLNAPVPIATEVEPELPSGVDRVFARALAKDPDDRPASCAELVSALREALRAESPPTLIDSGVPTVRMYAPPRRRPASLAYVLGAGAIVLAAFVLAIVLADGPNELGAKAERRTSTVSTTVETEQPRPVDGAALNDSGFALM
jgi:serine/threonine-protein kinase